MTRKDLAHLFISTIFLFAATMSSYAAESVDEAVSQIAESFAAIRSDNDPIVTVAVTSFVRSDQKNTAFADLFLSALTGKMVKTGRGKYRVVEKAQLDKALVEMQTAEVPIFDKDTVQELGKLLLAETLIVGEYTELADRVRIDARLIKVESILTIEQASVWVPLTPSIQKMLRKVTKRPGTGFTQEPSHTATGIWNGTTTCGTSSLGVALSLFVDDQTGRLSAMQIYYPGSRVGDAAIQPGALSMHGTVDLDSGEFQLEPEVWLHQPSGHEAMGITGVLNMESDAISAQYDTDACTTLKLWRANNS